jgi:hypothetical protein
MDKFQIYCNKLPQQYDNVLVKFTSRSETHIEGELLEYDLKCIMSYNDATKKKKIYSWNKIVPLYRTLVARVDEVFNDSLYVQVSIAYFTKSETNTNNEDEIQKQLMKPFNENKALVSFIRDSCHKLNIDFIEFWTNIIHPLDKSRRESKLVCSLLEYYINNFELVEELVKDETILKQLKKILQDKTYKIVSKIGIISINGINNTMNIIKTVTEKHKWAFTFKYESKSYYILESHSSTSTINDHNTFIEDLQNEIKKYDNVFSKVEYIGKEL